LLVELPYFIQVRIPLAVRVIDLYYWSLPLVSIMLLCIDLGKFAILSSLRPSLVVTQNGAFVHTFINSPCLVVAKVEYTFVRISELK